ncbi:MAG: SCO family protein [Bryobacteraceae bacterium]|nr:SCO family protein [Bryobacteraceae bacterium]
MKLAVALAAACLCLAANQLPPELEGVAIEERLGETIDLDLTFVAENGYPVALREYFGKGRPVLLNLVYYSCPMLCTLVLNGQVSVLREIPWTPGEEFEVVTISIDPAETFALAQKKKEMYLASYERRAPGWHFLTDHNGNVKRLAEQIGFQYRYDEAREQYAHAAAIMFLTAEGKVSRYLYGIKYKARDVRLALTEASEGKVGSAMDRVLLYCYHYDPRANSYVPFAMGIMRAGGALVALALGIVLWRLWRRERARPTPEIARAM